MEEVEKQKHFILVHGACHGAWCWYKVKPRLESAGHCVTAVDMAASGINMNTIHGIPSMYEYTKPLLEILDSLPPGEKVILVGHSLGGLNLAVAMEKYPEKISAAVFLTAFMPDTANPPSFVLEQVLQLKHRQDLRETANNCLRSSIAISPAKKSLMWVVNWVSIKYLVENIYCLYRN